MRRRLIQAAVVLVAVFAAAQIVRPDRTNPPTDPICAAARQAESSTARQR